ncbi:MAG: ATP-binding cassette domain-containing protein [Alphaproteobacteria bacterium]|nr:ATP-binding cassette domain-containing protein [Alphaproteobacteria bacterium]
MIKGLDVALGQRLRPHVRMLALFGLASNLLLLVSPLYMLQIYDRVMSSGSYDTLIWLTVIAVFLLMVYGAAEMGRRRVSALAGAEIEAYFAPRAFKRFEENPEGRPVLAQDLSRITRVQTYLQSGSVLPFADLPFTPLFLVVMFLIHPLIGMIGLAGTVLVFGVALAAELTSRQTSEASQDVLGRANQFATDLERQRSALVSMGLIEAAYRKWRREKEMGQDLSLSASKADGRFTAISRSARQTLQIIILGGGAALALGQEISPGSIVAASIILARVLAPVDQIVGGWRNSVQTWDAWRELTRDAVELPDQKPTPLPRPEAMLVGDRLAISLPGHEQALLQPFNFEAKPGEIIILAGAIGSGKTSLLQTLSGAWPAGSGTVSLGGRSIHDWDVSDRGRYIGYVPQDVELLPATIAENIARFHADELDALMVAAKAAGAHEAILALPDGYDTRVGPGGVRLSAGQRQLIGVARALYGNPSLLLFDEPTANLDSIAATSLINAIKAASQEGSVIMISSHDRRLIDVADTVLFLRQGTVFSTSTEQYLKLALGPGTSGVSPKGAAG